MKMLVSGAGDIKITKDGNVLLHEMQVRSWEFALSRCHLNLSYIACHSCQLKECPTASEIFVSLKQSVPICEVNIV